MLNLSLIQKLETLKLRVKRDFASNLKGERRSKRHGGSLEFADYRSYQPGDDFRYLDWNIYARLDKLFLKMFLDEQSVKVHIIIDSSRSMEFGSPSKFQYAKGLAAALAYISVLNLDSTSIVALSEKSINFSPPIRTKLEIPKLISFLDKLEPGHKTDFTESIRLYLQMSSEPKVIFLLTDLLIPEGYESGLKLLCYGGFDLKVIHIICEEEVNPNIQGDLKLEDIETHETREVTLTASKIEAYRSRLFDFFDKIERFSVLHDISYARVLTTFPLEEFILKELRKKGMIN